MTRSSIFIDTSFVIRLLTRDVEPLWEKARRLFSKIESGEIEGRISETVVFEAVYVLSTRYGMGRAAISDAMNLFLSLDGLVVPHHAAISRALTLWVSKPRLSFADSYHVVLAQETSTSAIAAFDKGMDNAMAGVIRIEDIDQIDLERIS